ncbi:MAG: hypothetical protein QXT31_03970 [Candidatus Bathyarchaeia archaeon]
MKNKVPSNMLKNLFLVFFGIKFSKKANFSFKTIKVKKEIKVMADKDNEYGRRNNKDKVIKKVNKIVKT